MVGCNCQGCCQERLPPPTAPPPPPAWPAAATLCGELTGHTLLLTSRSYTISCTVVVGPNATLEIEPGSTIGVAPANANANLISGGPAGGASLSAVELLAELEGRRGAPRRTVAALLQRLDVNGDCAVDAGEWQGLSAAAELAGAGAYLGAPTLVIARGGRLLADGSADAPITFALRDGSGALLADAEVPAAAHEAWGGLVVMGDAPVASAGDLAASLGGCWAGVSLPAEPYGGARPSDSSGVLRYVRVWHARRGVSLMGVGRGTRVENVEVVSSLSDGVVLHGGTVDVRRLSSLGAVSASFRMRAGYNGTAQFLFAMLGSTGRVGLSLAAEHALETYDATPPLAPRIFSATIIGGGAAGSASAASASLLELGDGGGTSGSGGAVGDLLLLHGSGDGVAVPASLALAQFHPPPPPFTAYSATLLHARATCGAQAADRVSEGVWLGEHATADECAQAAGEYRERNATRGLRWERLGDASLSGRTELSSQALSEALEYKSVFLEAEWAAFGVDAATLRSDQYVRSTGGSYYRPAAPASSDCLSFQHSAAYPVWGCLCCHIAAGGNSNGLWSVYQTHPSQPAVPILQASAAVAAALFVTPSTIVHGVAGRTFVADDGSAAAGTLVALADDPGLINVAAGCLSLACVRAATACTSDFDPLPSAHGAACAARSDDAAALGVDPPLEPVRCAGAFASWEAADHWLAGWSSLFPRHVGETPRSANGVAVGATGGVQVTVATGFLTSNSAVAARKPAELSLLSVTFDPAMCATSAFSANAGAHASGPVYWLMLHSQLAGTLRLSTCSERGDGFDTDLALFQLPSSSGGASGCAQPEQLACNGDGYGEAGCQHLYSALSTSVAAGTRYLVALKPHQASVLGDNVTFSASLEQPPPPPLPPPPPAPPPLPHSSDVQARIDSAPNGSAPILIHLDSDIELNATVTIPAGRRVVLRGTGSRPVVVRPGGGSFRLFDVADGGELYLSNLHLEAGATAGCGGAVRVRGQGALVGQFCRFEKNTASQGGGAICVESDGRLQLLAVNISGNTAGPHAAPEGANIRLGRPLRSFPSVDLIGVCLGVGALDCDSVHFSETLTPLRGWPTIWFEGRWTTSSCHTAEGCAFYAIASFHPSPYTNCQPLAGSTSGDANYGVRCLCHEGSGVGATSHEQIALSPYGFSPVDELLGLPYSVNCLDPLSAIARAPTRKSELLKLQLRKGGPSGCVRRIEHSQPRPQLP